MKKTARAFALCFIAAVLSACFLFSAGAEETAPAEMPPVDLDLSCMSGMVVYAQIYNLLCDPDPWLNKIIRMAGYYTFFEDLTTGTVYHACFVPDATACCAQGIEFVLASEYT